MVKGISHNIKEDLKEKGLFPDHIEGERDREPTWILIDYGDVVVHIFYEQIRSFYNLEWLWSDAAKLKLKVR